MQAHLHLRAVETERLGTILLLSTVSLAALSLTAFQWPTNINEVGPHCKLNFVTRLIPNSVTTSRAQDIQDNQGTRRAQKKAMVRKKSTLKFMQDSWRRTTSQSWSWRWQVLQVHASTMCNGAIAFLRTGGDPPPPVPPPNVGRSIYIEISAGCNKSKANSLCQSYAVMQVVKWLASSASQRGKGARS